MRLLGNGNFGIGTTSAGTTLQIGDGTGDEYITIDKSATGASGILFKNAGNNKVKLLCNSAEEFELHVNNALALYVDESKNVLVGGTTTFNNLSTESGVLASNNVLMARGGLADHQDACAVLQYTSDAAWLRAYGDTAGSGYMVFRTGGGAGSGDTERMRLLAGGGLTFNGDTAAANALDDYEEGTWTPDLRNGTTSLSTQTWQYGPTATYTKIGRMVYIHMSGKLSSVAGTGSGELRIFGLPFTPAGTGGYQEYRVNMVLGDQVNSSDRDLFGFIRNAGSDIGTRIIDGGDTPFTSNRIDSDTFMSFWGAYFTA